MKVKSIAECSPWSILQYCWPSLSNNRSWSLLKVAILHRFYCTYIRKQPSYFARVFLLRQGLSEPEFYGDLVYKLKKIVGSDNFSAQFIKIIFPLLKDWL